MRMLALTMALMIACPCAAQQKSIFPDGKHLGGELQHIGSIPVLTVGGDPETIGAQYGTLALKPASDLPALSRQLLKDQEMEDFYPLAVTIGKGLLLKLNADQRTEFESAVKASGLERDAIVFGNTAFDVAGGFGCSTLVVEKSRSRTGQPLFGRNFDWYPTKGIAEHTIVVIHRPKGKHAFVSISITPSMGVFSGMNDAGLALTLNEIYESKDGSKYSPDGPPFLFALRRVLEECTTIEEAEKLLRSVKRTRLAAVTLCDRQGGAVFEISPKSLVVRKPSSGMTVCTNHFISPELGKDKRDWRLERLTIAQQSDAKLGVEEIIGELKKVDQGKFTLHMMVFEPATLKLHLAYGPGKATTRQVETLDLKKLFE